jgi:hypothetical protein
MVVDPAELEALVEALIEEARLRTGCTLFDCAPPDRS